jgi:hypothetical protein
MRTRHRTASGAYAVAGLLRLRLPSQDGRRVSQPRSDPPLGISGRKSGHANPRQASEALRKESQKQEGGSQKEPPSPHCWVIRSPYHPCRRRHLAGQQEPSPACQR